jgi:TonB family protein
MAELLAAGPYYIVMAFGAAVALELLRRIAMALLRLAGRLRHAARPPKADNFLTGLFSYLLFPFLAFIAFIPPLVLLTSVAILLGFDPGVKIGSLANGALLLWTFTIAFLWIQIWYLMSLPRFGQRLRYLVLLLALPLLAQLLTWLCIGFLHARALADAAALKAPGQLGHLISLGLLPFLLPLIHAHFCVPFFTWASNLPAERWRLTVTRLGNGLLSVAVLGIFAWYGCAAGAHSGVQVVPEPQADKAPASVGAPHVCVKDYPALSVRLGEQGTVILRFRITATGTVRDIEIAQSSGSDRLDLASALCVSRWTYSPAKAKGRNIETSWKARIVWILH